MRKNICMYGIAAVSLIGIVTAAVSDIKMFQSVENDFLNRHSKIVAEELEEIRDEIGTVYEHFEEIENIRNYGR